MQLVRILVPWTGIKPLLLALGAQSLTHWTASKVPSGKFISNVKLECLLKVQVNLYTEITSYIRLPSN